MPSFRMNQEVQTQDEPEEVRIQCIGRSGVSAGQFLCFLVHERGIEMGLKSQEVVRTMVPPTMKRELQQLIGKINFVRRFISNLYRQMESFMDLVKIKADEEFRWG
jgi:hypothetical protein